MKPEPKPVDESLPLLRPDGVNPARARRAVRNLYARPSLRAGDLMAPLLVVPVGHPGLDLLPGAVALADVPATVTTWPELGIAGIKVFVHGHDRDDAASGAVSPDNLMVRSIQSVRSAGTGMALTTEVCGCSWTSSGECVLRDEEGAIDLGRTHTLMQRMAVQHAEAGADIVSPTAMLSGSVHAMRSALNNRGLRDVGVCPNLAIHTMLYGPFKTIMETNPAAGHRRGLQLEPGRAAQDTLLQARAWIAEGADSLTLQPVLTASDVLVELRRNLAEPLVAYSTSGEWKALEALGIDGMVEYLAMLKRAGADSVLTFAAEQVARHLRSSHG
ncbi:hypothetical protein ACH4U5_37950 [Streptomyces sp. NPDC020858]|uniref:hypothetical protein n=1 Tax=Streptomyces sp. NPDC020858 TaxID=3365097 RepID=UPI0037BBD564